MSDSIKFFIERVNSSINSQFLETTDKWIKYQRKLNFKIVIILKDNWQVLWRNKAISFIL